MKKIFLATLAGILLFSSSGFSETFSGEIREVRFLDDGRTEIVVKTNSKQSSFIVNETTVIETSIAAKNLKSGQRILLNPAGGSTVRGFQSPFKGIPGYLRNKMGLPDIPSTPDIPQTSGFAPNIPKIPKTPKVGGQPQATAPSEEEKTLFGRMEASKSISKSEAAKAPLPAPAIVAPPSDARKVLKVESGKQEVKLELESTQGQKENMVMASDKEVIQALSISDLRKNMNIQLEALSAGKNLLARKITVKK